MSSHTHDKMKVDLVTEGPFSWMYSAHRFDPLNPVAFFKKEADANLFGAAQDLLFELIEQDKFLGVLAGTVPLSEKDTRRRIAMHREYVRAAIARATRIN